MSRVLQGVKMCLGLLLLMWTFACTPKQYTTSDSSPIEGDDERGAAQPVPASSGNESLNNSPIKSKPSTRDILAKSPGYSSPEPSSFEALVAGLEHCEFDNWYIDPPGLQPAHSYFIERNLQACNVDEAAEIAYFCVSENFHGMHVSKIEMQSSTAATSRGLHLDAPLVRARSILRKALRNEFRRSAESENAQAPILISDPSNQNKSLLICVYPYGY